ncbi:MAG: metal-dependent hydrolase [Burkholderiales bacterium]|nr:metal-dependent hydrolase [Burkholderiales bacterium]
MDSVSQFALGAAVGVAAMGRRTAVWKAALWGGVAGTLPDLDVLIDQGDAVRNMVLHRAESHSLFWLTLFSLPFAALVARIQGQWTLWRRWWLALWLSLVTHPLLDLMTVYGTQIALPFSNHPFAVGSVFIIDPLYTLPLLIGTGWALATREKRGAPALMSAGGVRANAVGLILSTAYLGYGLAVQQHVTRVAHATLAAQGIAAERVIVMPSAFNSVLWRVVVVAGDEYLEGFHSLLDRPSADAPVISFERYPRGNALIAELQGTAAVELVRAFSKGFHAMRVEGSRVIITDLRMGQEPAYIFSFAVAERSSPAVPLAKPEQIGARPDLGCGLPWIWRRMWGEPMPPLVRHCARSAPPSIR